MRQFTTILVVASLLTVAVTPAAAFGDSAETPSIVRYGSDAAPSFVVHLSDDAGAADSLRDWVNASDSRTLVELDNATNTATVAARYPEVTGRSFSFDGWDVYYHSGEQLVERSYVESVAPNYRLQYVQPVSDAGREDEFTPETIGITAYNDPEFATEGLAFTGDANRTTMADVRSILGVVNVSADTSGMTIAVVDTGANTANGRAFGNGSTNSPIRISNASKNFVNDESVNASAGDFTAIEDGNGHGTWTLAAAIGNASGTEHDGMAPDATGLVLKALDDDGSGSTSDIAAAIRYAANHDADVISLSLGSPIRSEAIVEAIRYAQDEGSVVVAATGNSRMQGRAPGIATPADVEGVIGVGASNGSAAPNAWSASFSQVTGTQATDGNLENEERVDVVAPGMQTVAMVATSDGRVQEQTLSGTSMATPEVAGALLVAMAQNASLADASPQEIHDAVGSAARPAPNMAAVEAGNGMFAADNLADGTRPELLQEDAMTDPAKQRQTFYEAASDAAGGWAARFASRTGA